MPSFGTTLQEQLAEELKKLQKDHKRIKAEIAEKEKVRKLIERFPELKRRRYNVLTLGEVLYLEGTINQATDCLIGLGRAQFSQTVLVDPFFKVDEVRIHCEKEVIPVGTGSTLSFDPFKTPCCRPIENLREVLSEIGLPIPLIEKTEKFFKDYPEVWASRK